MKHEGPALETLLRRLADTPRDFLDPPRDGHSSTVHLDALVFDISHEMGEPCSAEDLNTLKWSTTNWKTLCAIGCWFLADERLQACLGRTRLLHILGETVRALADEYQAERYILDPERREEFVRIVLSDLELRPAGETEPQAQDRLQALSSTERRRIVAATREAEKRARKIREALIRKAAAEAADKYTRE
ncbi:MAG: hypothetical protein LBB76_11865 [Azoarcus sp.]|jgi:hypothetical protein|nr:hypothetical protein [Azoarcus sp.]